CEDLIAGGAEALPQRLVLLLGRRADVLPLLLELLALRLRVGGLGLVALGHLPRPLPLRLFLLLVALPFLLDLVELPLSLVRDDAGGAEALPQRLVLLLGRRPQGLPLRLQPLDELRGRLPVRRAAQALHARAQLLFLALVLGPILVDLGVVQLALLEERVARGL